MNQLVASQNLNGVTMTSREIAELTGKQHTNVIRDIRKMLADLGQAELKFESSYKDATGRKLLMFALPKRETLILVSGYDTTLRAKVVDRLAALEQASQAPRSPAEMLLAMAQQMVANEQRLNGMDDRIAKIEAKHSKQEQAMTVLEFSLAHGLATEKAQLQSFGLRAASASRMMGYEITTKHQDHKGFRGNVNAYHPDVLLAVAGYQQ